MLGQPPRTAGGYRDYDQAALQRLGFVRAAQAVGLTLGEIRGIIGFRDRGQPPCAHVVTLLQRRAAELDARIAELERIRGDLEQLAQRARAWIPTTARQPASATSSADPSVPRRQSRDRHQRRNSRASGAAWAAEAGQLPPCR